MVIKGEKGKIHNRKEFDSELKTFKRFLKDNGYFKHVMSFLFPGGKNKRTIDDLYKIMLYFDYLKFPNIFNYDDTLGPAYKSLDFAYWDIFIRPIHEKWLEFWCNKNNVLYTKMSY